MAFITDRGKPTQIVWFTEANDVRRLPGQNIALGVLPVPRKGGDTRVISQVFAPVSGVSGDPDLAAFYQADWFLTPSTGLAVENVRLVQRASPADQVHNIVESMQWQHFRLIGDRGPNAFPALEFPLQDSACAEPYLINAPGLGRDNKLFAWAAGASFGPFHIPHPSIPSTIYTVTVNQSFIFGAPAADIEPSASVIAVKVTPVLTVTIESSEPINFPPPSFAADLRLVFAPRLTRPDQHRLPKFFPNSPRRGTNVVNLFCDTNDLTRPVPGQGTFIPNSPDWDAIFDYAEPELSTEISFDAVVFPDFQVSNQPYFLVGPAGTLKSPMLCSRVNGQGEFDNIHIHPWVGFDDPSGASATADQTHALVEAPLAADEVIHMHWRWGVPIPEAAKTQGERLARTFRGYSAQGVPNVQNGAPLIPPNQSLRMKISHPQHDVNDPTGGPLDRSQTVVWYSPTFHNPQNRGYTQFCGHGFAYAYRLRDLIPPFIGPAVTNADLLDDPLVAPSYHSVRWNGSAAQKVPTASKVPGLSRNRLGPGSPDQNVFSF